MQSITYPNSGGTVSASYADLTAAPNMPTATAGLAAAINRPSGLTDWNGVTVQTYAYLGLSQVVQLADPQVNLALSYINRGNPPTNTPPSNTSAYIAGGDKYTGLDRFSRVDEQAWSTIGGDHGPTTSYAVQLQYGYNQDSLPTYQLDVKNPAFTEIFHYDTSNRLDLYELGTIDPTTGLLTLNPDTNIPNEQNWTYDLQGNKIGGSFGNNNQTINYNSENQAISGGTYANSGNETQSSLSTDGSTSSYVYDAAEQRLVSSYVTGKLRAGTSVHDIHDDDYTLDALGNRIQIDSSDAIVATLLIHYLHRR